MLTLDQIKNENVRNAALRNGFTFNGVHSSEFYLFVEKFPDLTTASRKQTPIKIAGRSGNLHYEEFAWDNVNKSYQCYFHSPDSMPNTLARISGWLNQPGYWRLEDGYDSDHFRMANFTGPMDVANHLNKYGRCTITFDCMPQRWLVSGEIPVTFTTAGTLFNPTEFPAKPLVIVNGSGPGNVTVGTATVKIKALGDQIILDCEMLNAYRKPGEGAAENKNSSVYAPVFPKLTPGMNAVSFDGDIDSVTVIPRWWTL